MGSRCRGGPLCPRPSSWFRAARLLSAQDVGLSARVRGCGPSPRPPPASPATPGVTHTAGCVLCLSACVSPAQSTARLDSDRTPSTSSTAERGMVKPMVRVEQQLDYRRQDSRWGRAPCPGLGGTEGLGQGSALEVQLSPPGCGQNLTGIYFSCHRIKKENALLTIVSLTLYLDHV